MKVKNKLLVLLAFILTFGGTALAQEPEPPPAPGATVRPQGIWRPRGRHQMRRLARLSRLRVLRELNLSQEQKQVMRSILDNQRESTRARREELFQLRQKRRSGELTPGDQERAKTLVQEMRAASQARRAELAAILTPEQRARLEELKQQRQTRHKEMLKRRQQFRKPVPE